MRSRKKRNRKVEEVRRERERERGEKRDDEEKK